MIPGFTEPQLLALLCVSGVLICAVVIVVSKRQKRAIDFPKILALASGYLLTLAYCAGYVVEQWRVVNDGKAPAATVFLPIVGIAILGWFCVKDLHELLSPPVPPKPPANAGP